jgi:hypothetical protein
VLHATRQIHSPGRAAMTGGGSALLLWALFSGYLLTLEIVIGKVNPLGFGEGSRRVGVRVTRTLTQLAGLTFSA